MRVLVTGGAGFVGSHTVDLLLSEGHEVVVVDNLDPQIHHGDGRYPLHLRRHAENPRFTFTRGDVRDTDVLRTALRGADAVLHLAAAVGVGQSMYEPLHYADVNVTGTAALLQAVLGVRGQLRRIVVASSMSIYGEGAYACGHCRARPAGAERGAGGEGERRWDPRCRTCGGPLTPIPTGEDTPLAPASIYAISKRVQEEMALCFGRAYHLPTIALRYFNIYGTRQAMHNPYTGALAIFLSRLLNGKPPLVFEDGLQSRDFIHVSDIARANMLALTSDRTGCAVFNVGTGRATSIVMLARELARGLRLSLEPEILYRSRAGDIRHCYADISAARRGLGWTPAVALRDGIADLVAWARTERPPDRLEDAVRELTQQGLVR